MVLATGSVPGITGSVPGPPEGSGGPPGGATSPEGLHGPIVGTDQPLGGGAAPPLPLYILEVWAAQDTRVPLLLGAALPLSLLVSRSAW